MVLSSRYSEWMGYRKTPVVNPQPHPLLVCKAPGYIFPSKFDYSGHKAPAYKPSFTFCCLADGTPLTEPVGRGTIFCLLCHEISQKKLSLPGKDLHKFNLLLRFC